MLLIYTKCRLSHNKLFNQVVSNNYLAAFRKDAQVTKFTLHTFQSILKAQLQVTYHNLSSTLRIWP